MRKNLSWLRIGLCALFLFPVIGCDEGEDEEETAGEDESGGDESGGDESGEDESGGDESGGDESGGDESGGDESGDDGVSFTGDVFPIFETGCGCHVASSPAGLAMPDAATAYANLVDVKATQAADLNLVTAGDPEQSYLWHKLSDTQGSVSGSGGIMPPARQWSADG